MFSKDYVCGACGRVASKFPVVACERGFNTVAACVRKQWSESLMMGPKPPWPGDMDVVIRLSGEEYSELVELAEEECRTVELEARWLVRANLRHRRDSRLT